MSITVPYSFIAGTTILSAEVNSNFTTLAGAAFNKTGDTLTGSLLFSPDNTLDIGAAGATRARDFFLGRNALIGGTLGITGVATFTAAPVFSNDIKVAATKLAYLDGGGNTYLTESAADTLDVYTNGVKALTIDSTQFIDSATQPRTQVTNSAPLTVTAGNTTLLTFDTEVLDVGALHSTSVNTGRLTVPTGGDGAYWIWGSSKAYSLGTGTKIRLILKKTVSGPTMTELDSSDAYQSNNANNDFAPMRVGFLANLVAGDYVELYGAAVTNNVQFGEAGVTGTLPKFGMVKLW